MSAIWSVLQEILARDYEEEERSKRRSRELQLQQAQASKRVRVVDNLGRAYSTGTFMSVAIGNFCHKS